MRYELGFDTIVFRKNLSQILEYDYGDFMRSANVYLNKLRAELHVINDKNIDCRLDRMQMYLVFTPNWDIELTRKLLAKDTKYIDDLLLGHNQDWESASSSFNFLGSCRVQPLSDVQINLLTEH